MESGELLYPATSTEGREVIRQDLRELRESWDGYIDRLSEADRRLQMTLGAWGAYDDRYAQLTEWLRDLQINMADLELKNTLPEKKALLQAYKVGKLGMDELASWSRLIL